MDIKENKSIRKIKMALDFKKIKNIYIKKKIILQIYKNNLTVLN